MVSTFHRGFQCWGHIPYLFCIHPYLVSRAHFLVRLCDCHSCTYMNNKFCAVLHLHCRNRGSCWGGAAWPYVSVSTGPKTGVQNGVQKWDTLGARTVRAPGGPHFGRPFWPPPWGTLLESALGHNMMCPWTRLDMAGHPMTVTRTTNDDMNRALAPHQERRHRYAIHNIRH